MAEPGLGQKISATFDAVAPTLQDETIKNNGLLEALEKKGNIQPVTGGNNIRHNIEYAENSSGIWYSGNQRLNLSVSDFITAAQFEYKQFAINLQMSGEELIKNAGDAQLVPLLASKIRNKATTIKNTMGRACYGDGTGSGGKELGGLQLLISTTPALGIVGGIDASLWEFWRNTSFRAINDGGSATSAENIVDYLDAMYVQLIRKASGDKPQLHVCDNDYYSKYKKSLKSIQRITDRKNEGLSGDYMYEGATVVLDGGIGGACPFQHWYMINTDHLMLRPSSVRNNVNVGGDRHSFDQDAYINFNFWAGNLTCNSRITQGVLSEGGF